jgi:release factor glutamine methyltransferase
MNGVRDLLLAARANGVDKLDAHLLMAFCTGRSRTWLIAHDDSPLPIDQHAQFTALATRRAAGEPLAYLLGEKEFHGLNLKVNAHVLVPRPDTEVLVEWALEVLRTELSAHAAPRVIDLGCGSGAIALALKQACPRAEVSAVDVSAPALAVAQGNATALGLEVRFLASDWWQGVAGEPFDLAVSNPPYIAAHDPHLAALRHEPTLALTSGLDGLDALRVIVFGAGAHLHKNAWLLVEHGHDQSAQVQALLGQSGFNQAQSRTDLAGHVRCTGGRC